MKNKKSQNFGLFIFLFTFIAITFSSIGFAALNTELSISGTAEMAGGQRYWWYDYTGAVQTFTAPYDGIYEVTLWGAGSGGSATGAVTKGRISLKTGDTLYLYLGGFGDFNSSNKTFNGGGASGPNGVQGGGASDVRLIKGSSNTDWDNIASLRSRIMVAAGAGGAKYGATTTTGGLLYGTVAKNNDSGYVGTPATQLTAGSAVTFNEWWPSSPGTEGSFATGGDELDGDGWGWTDYGGAGGGGYYGGGSSSKSGTGGGGSSYISGFAGVNSINSSGAHTNQTLHYSGKYFYGSTMQASDHLWQGQGMVNYIGNEEKTSFVLNEVRYIKSCMSGTSTDNYAKWSEIQAIKNGTNLVKNASISATFPTSADSKIALNNVKDGNIDTIASAYGSYTGNQCITIDLGSVTSLDELAIWGSFENGNISHNSIFSISKDNANWVPLHNHVSYAETSQGIRYSDW